MKTIFSKNVETFNIDEYVFPRYTSPTVNIENYRNFDLNSSDSSYSREWRCVVGLKAKSSKLPKHIFNSIQEFPIIINDPDLWDRILKDFGITERKYHNQKHFKLDYFYPTLGVAVEIDSNLHNKVYDQARDCYVKEKFGILTLRFFEYMRDKLECMDKFIDTAKKILRDKKSSGIPEDSRVYINFDNCPLSPKTDGNNYL